MDLVKTHPVFLGMGLAFGGNPMLRVSDEVVDVIVAVDWSVELRPWYWRMLETVWLIEAAPSPSLIRTNLISVSAISPHCKAT